MKADNDSPMPRSEQAQWLHEGEAAVALMWMRGERRGKRVSPWILS
jgi:hypothetical protein